MNALGYDYRPAKGPARRHCLVLHGLGDSRRGWQPVADHLDLPDVAFVFAEAPLAYHGGFSWFRMDESLASDRGDVERSADLLRQLITSLGRDHGATPATLAIMGFSQGCLMTLEVGLRADVRFAALIGLSGWLDRPGDYPAAFGPAVQTQQLHWFHGQFDPLVPVRLVRQQAADLRAHGLAVDWREFPAAHSLDPGAELAAIRKVLA